MKIQLRRCIDVQNSKEPYSADLGQYVGLEHITSWTGEVDLGHDAQPDGLVTHFKRGDVLFGKLRPYLAKVTAPNFDGVCSTEILVLRPKKGILPQYIRYCLASPSFIDRINAATFGVKMPRASWENLGAEQIFLPDAPKQILITDFLDMETGRVDTLIQKKIQLIKILAERARAKITLLVKGNGKASGFRLRHVASLNPSAREIRIEKDDLVTFCAMDALEDGIGGLDTSTMRVLSEVKSGSYNYFASGDILLAKVTPCFENGKKALAQDIHNGIGFATSEVFVIRPDTKRVNAEYLLFLLSSEDFQFAGRASMTGAGGLRRISDRSILDFPLFVTELGQQQLIVDEINRLVASSQAISNATNRSIERLKEYRAALITAAVTGQIDVTRWKRSGSTDRQLDAIQEEVGA